MSDTTNAAVRRYYERRTTRLGYNLIMGGNKHFGYYDERHRTERQAQQRFMEKFWELLRAEPGMHLLDAGCGQGLVAVKTAATSRASVTGITVVPFEVEAARKLGAKKGMSDLVDFKLQDYSSLKGEPLYDRIYTVETLSHAPDVRKVVDNFMQLLKPGGELVCIEYECDYTALTPEQARMIDFAINYGALHGAKQFGPGQFMQTLKAAGFKDVKEHDWTTACLPSFQRIRRIARPFRYLVAKLGLQEKHVNTVIARYYADMAEEGKFWFKAYTARKPGQ